MSFHSDTSTGKFLFATIVLLIITALFFSACKDDGDGSLLSSGLCPPPTALSNNSICLIINGEMEINTLDKTNSSPFNADPAVSYNRDSADPSNDVYRIVSAKEYSAGSTDYFTDIDFFDGFGSMIVFEFDTEPTLGTLDFNSTPKIVMSLYSPMNTSDVYAANSGTTGTTMQITISKTAPNIGDSLQGTIGPSIMCKVNSRWNTVDNCLTSVGIFSGSFNINRSDNQF